MNRFSSKLHLISTRLNRVLAGLAGGLLLCMILLTCANIFARSVSNFLPTLTGWGKWLSPHIPWLGGMIVSLSVYLREVIRPIPGVVELMGFMGALVLAFTLGYTRIHKGHIAVDVCIRLFSKKVQIWLLAANNLLLCVFSGLIAYQVMVKGLTIRKYGEVSETLGMQYSPVVFGVAIGALALCLVFAVDFLVYLFPEPDEDGSGQTDEGGA